VAFLIIPEVSHPEMNKSLAHLVFKLHDCSYVKQPAGGVVHIKFEAQTLFICVVCVTQQLLRTDEPACSYATRVFPELCGRPWICNHGL
jgi:hypothetical protein